MFIAVTGLYNLFLGIFYALMAGTDHAPPFGGEVLWGWIFIAVGVFSLSGVFIDEDRWHFAANVFLYVVWGMQYMVLSQVVDFDWLRGLTFMALASIVALVANWPEPRRIQRLRFNKKG